MKLATVVGTIWATQRDPQTEGLTLQIIAPEDVDGTPVGEPLVAVDTVGAGVGERVFFVTSREAVIPLEQETAPVDASIIGIVEGVSSTDLPSTGRER